VAAAAAQEGLCRPGEQLLVSRTGLVVLLVMVVLVLVLVRNERFKGLLSR
jgi:hypothetical protein